VGEKGVVVHSDDNGFGWKAQKTPTDKTLWNVAVGKGVAWAVGVGGTILQKKGGGAWSELQSGANRDLFAIWTDGTQVFAGGRAGTILQAGINDTTLRAQSAGSAHDVMAMTQLPGGDLLAVGAGGSILRSSRVQRMAGVWTQQTPGAHDDDISGIEADARAIYAVGEHGLFLRSEDAGASWRQAATGVNSDYLTRVRPNGRGEVLAVGWDGLVLRSTDWGLNWETGASGIKSALNGLAYLGDAVFAVGQYGVILKSEDGGQSFRRLESKTKEYLEEIWGDDRAIFASGANGALLQSDRRGEKWLERISGTDENLWTGITDDAGNVHVFGTHCIYVRSPDLGEHWEVPKKLCDDETLFGAWGVSHKDLYAAGTGGTLLRSPDGGVTWARLQSGTSQQLYAVWGDGRGTIWAAGRNGTILTGTAH
jgi:photosystem II stability/assembly factor-like uncharacterized protein